MKIINFKKISACRNIVLVLGNFDGVHKGHKKLISEAIKFAKKNKLPCFAMTFDPHPQEVVNPGRGLCLLTTLSERIELMRELGLDGVIIKEFNKKISRLSPDAFVKTFLINELRVRKIFVGFDFAFGRNRAGGVSILKKLGLEVHAVSPFKAHGHLVKSSTIRSMIADGNLSKAVKLLGHPYSLTGKVVKGAGRGKELGFPTANITIAKDKLIPKHGVYAGKLITHNLKLKAAVFIGSRPTFGKESFAIEAHVIGFNGDLRGRTVRIELLKRLRDEIHFSDVEKLKAQIKKDVEVIRRFRSSP
jgi:riboflavin kinase/FMN adenylyltransferase